MNSIPKTGGHAPPWPGRSLVQCAFALIALLFVAASSAHAGEYSVLADAIQQQARTNRDLLQAAHLPQAQQGLGSLARSFRKIAEGSESLSKRSTAEHDACMARVAQLTQQIGALYQREQQTRREIEDLSATLAKVMEDGRLLDGERVVLSEALNATTTALAAHRAKLDELQRWWWVPGYGLFLSIRTLVDGDIEKSRSLSVSLHDIDTRIRSNRNHQAAVERLRAELERTKAQTSAGYQALNEMRASENARLTTLKEAVATLTAESVYVAKVNSFANVTARGYIADLQALIEISSTAQQAGLVQLLSDYDDSIKPVVDPLPGYTQRLDQLESMLSHPSCATPN